MSDEWKLGDRFARQGREGMILARDGKWAWVVYDSEDGRFTEMVSALTRIKPDVPKPKYSVGDWVRVRSTGRLVEILRVYYPQDRRYECRNADGFHCQVGEAGLDPAPEVCCQVGEAGLDPAPEVCPTCGKVRDD